MKLYNIIDEQGRFCGFKVDINQRGNQRDTHTYSYLYCREMYKNLGEEMGLDKHVAREVAALQIQDIKKHYQLALNNNVVKPGTTLTKYVTDIYCRHNSILPELFRYRLERGLVQ